MTPEEAAKKFGTLVGTFGTTWSPRTNLRKQKPSEPEAAQPGESQEQWTYSRAVFIRTLSRFPDALDAVRQALVDLRRRCPKELYDPA